MAAVSSNVIEARTDIREQRLNQADASRKVSC